MSRDIVNIEQKTKQDITWKELIQHSESEISACRLKMERLRKSLKFFRKQAENGVPFPVPSSREKGKCVTFWAES
jgi:hypothetical protein